MDLATSLSFAVGLTAPRLVLYAAREGQKTRLANGPSTEHRLGGGPRMGNDHWHVLDKRQQPLSPAHKAVQRAKDEHRVNRRIRLREPTGITDFSGHRPVLSCGSDMLRNDVECFWYRPATAGLLLLGVGPTPTAQGHTNGRRPAAQQRVKP